MAKRSADKELTHDNWDQEEQDDEEAGFFRAASKDVLEKREIKKAKRRVTDDKGGASAFKGFSFGVATPAAMGSGSKPFSFAMQPNSTTGASASTFAFGGFTAASGAMQTVTLTASLSTGGSPKPAGAADTESQYRRSLRNLNESVLRWIDDHIKTNPYCILTPIFGDYEKYIKELDRDFPQSADKVVGGAPVVTTAAATVGFTFPSSSTGASSAVSPFVVSNSQTSTSVSAAAGLFGSGTTAANSVGKPAAPPTSTPAFTTGFSAPGRLFGAQDSNVSTSFSSGAAPSVVTTSSGLNFGAQPSTEATSSTSGFLFALQQSKAATSNTSGFTFGAPTSMQPDTSLASKDANLPVSGFNFGAQTSKQPGTSLASKDANPSSSGFSFGAQTSNQPDTSLASKEAKPALSGFTFSFLPAKGAASTSAPAGASTSAANEGGEDETYVPPKPDVVEIKEEDAFYTVRCKLYYKIDDAYKERGIGNLYLKPCGEKTQLLVRAGTTLGNILLNIMLNKSIPTSRQLNNVTMVCVPNPPLDDKNPDDKTPVCMLLRVKTEDDAEALLQQINVHKV